MSASPFTVRLRPAPWVVRGAPLLLVALALVVSGCMSNRTRGVTPLAAAPSAPVQTATLAPPQLPPEPEAPISDEPLPGVDGSVPGDGTAVAAASPALEVGRTDLLGGWAIASAGEECQLFMSLTTWTGGYRASTRGCTSPQLSGISAWDLNGSTVTLKTGEGAAPVASLQATDAQRFSGATVDGASITVAR